MRGSAMMLAAALAALPAAACAQAQPSIVPALERLAARGNAEAAYHLGMAYHTGSGVARDPAKALAAFRRAAEGGDPLGAYKLGCFYAGQGEGTVAPDTAQALRWKLVAAEAGYALAQQDVAAILAEKGDVAAALGWLDRSLAQGWSDGLMTAASVYNGFPGAPRDPAKTAAYFRLYLDRSEGSDDQRRWLGEFEAKLTPAERAEAARLVAGYRPKPTPLTIKALSGLRAARALAATAG